MVLIKKTLIHAILMLMVCFALPVQAFASAGDVLRSDQDATLYDYLLYKAVVDGLNQEYGSLVVLMPWDELIASGLPLPKAATQESLAEYEKEMRWFIEWGMTTSYQAQLDYLTGYLDPSCTYSDGEPPFAFDNESPWAVQTLFRVAERGCYGEVVIQYVADRNPSFAAMARQRGFLPTLNDGYSLGCPENNPISEQQSRGLWTYTYYIPQSSLGTASLSGLLSNSSGYWQWLTGASAYWTIGNGNPYFYHQSHTKSLLNKDTLYKVVYTGQLIYNVGGYPSYQSHTITVNFDAATAAVLAGL